MPRLPLEPAFWPASLFDAPQPGHWWVLHVKPRAEKSLARRCFARESSFFLPQFPSPSQGKDRSKESYLPLFPGYVFLFGDERDRIVALESNLVANVLSVPHQEELFEELKRIHLVMESGLSLLPGERLTPGTAVSIVDGPLRGLQGTVARLKSKLTLVLKISFLQQAALVEIESWMVEPMVGPLSAKNDLA